MNCKELAEFLVNETPMFDEEIMKSIRMESNWLGVVEGGRPDLSVLYHITLESVRKLSEGAHYKGPFRGCALRVNLK